MGQMYFYNNKVIGQLGDDLVFRKRIKRSIHVLRKYDAIGIQFDTLKDLEASGCEEIRILDTENNMVYSIPFDKIYKEGKVEDFGEGMQAFLPRSQWNMKPYKKKK